MREEAVMQRTATRTAIIALAAATVLVPPAFIGAASAAARADQAASQPAAPVPSDWTKWPDKRWPTKAECDSFGNADHDSRGWKKWGCRQEPGGWYIWHWTDTGGGY
jgi:hypothetical protein